jgi:enamine deaminase RidA (YjgF/YER057c/UK114 family)
MAAATARTSPGRATTAADSREIASCAWRPVRSSARGGDAWVRPASQQSVDGRLNERHILRIDNDARLSRVVHNGIVYLSGVAASERVTDIAGQTRQVLARLDGYFAAAGTDKSRLLTAQVWLKDIARDFDGMNREWMAWTAPDCAPTRATAQCPAGAPGILIEFTVTAATALRAIPE